MVLGINKRTAPGGFLPPAMVSSLISVKWYLVLSEAYPDLLKMDNMDRTSLKQYLSYWKSAK